MTAGALGLIIPLISGAVALLKWWSNYFSDSSVLRRLQLALERQKARMEVEAERLLRAYDRIEGDPDKAGQDLTDALNDKFKATRPRTLSRRLLRLSVRQILHLLLLLALLSGCSHVPRPEPNLIFPPWPKLHFVRVEGGGQICLSEADAGELEKWADKLRAFEAARQRLLKN